MGDRSFVGHARTIGIVSLCSKLLGLTRDVLTSHFFGAGILWDVFTLAWRIPNLFMTLFGEGALEAAFIPSFVERWDSGRALEARELFNRVVTRIFIASFFIVLAGIAVTVVVPRFITDAKTVLFFDLLRIMLPFLCFFCVSAIMAATLMSLRHFAAPFFLSGVINIVFIAALFLSAGVHVEVIAWAVVVGGIFQVGLVFFPLLAKGVRFRPDFRSGKADRAVYRVFVPLAFGAILIKINDVLDVVIAELFVPGHGAVSVLYYATQLHILPLTLLAVPIAAAVFPALSSPESDMAGLVGKALRGIFYLCIPATFGLLMFAPQLIALIFEHGAFDATDRTSVVLRLLAPSLCFTGANFILLRVFYARKDPFTPLKAGFFIVALNLVMNLALVGPYREAGIAFASATSAIVYFVVLLLLLRKRIPNFGSLEVGRTILLSTIAAVIMAGTAWPLHRWVFSPLFPGEGLLRECARILFPIVIAVGVYFGTTLLMGMTEARMVLRRRR
jgi:putative peptidoglycan lipid II flippase